LTTTTAWPAAQRYTRVAILLHWSIALLIVLNFSIAWFMEDLGEPYRTLVVRTHQSSGITVLLLSVVRIAWRLTHRPPPLDPSVGRIDRVAAKVVHAIFYVAIVGLPLSGWALISANPPRYEPARVAAHDRTGAADIATPGPRRLKRIKIWGVVSLIPIKPIQEIAKEPGGIARQRVIHDTIVEGHAIAGYGLLALVVLHVLGALKHEWIERTPELYRMGIGRRDRRPS
jgi:cytochrome b561